MTKHAAVRNNAGVFDVSHMGEFILKGENALDLLQRVTTNDVQNLQQARLNIVVLPMKTAALLMICWFIALKITRCT